MSVEIARPALEIINRQKAEIERLNDTLNAAIAGQETLQKHIATQQAEIERLEAEVDKQYEQAKADILGNMADGGMSCHWCIEEHRNRAVKEFAERLKGVNLYEFIEDYFENAEWCYEIRSDLFVDCINHITKEMVGDNNVNTEKGGAE